MSLKRTTLAALLALASSASMAQGAKPADTGLYIGGSVGQSSVDVDCTGFSCDDTDTAFKIFGGYQINRNFAVEIGYSDFGKITATAPGASLEVKSNAFEFVAVGALPLSPEFSVYGKLGLYRGEAKASATLGALSGSQTETTTDLTYGLGLQYNFNRHFGIRGEWQSYPGMGGGDIGDDFDVNVLSVGVTWKF